MKITKYGHCCLLIEGQGVRIVTDPGSFTAESHVTLTNIHAILYTHEHADHFHLASLKQLLVSNPGVRILCNEGVSALLRAEDIAHEVVTNGELAVNGVSVQGVSGIHEEIHSSIPRIQNTGFLVGGRLWYPGDAFIDPRTPVDILALPVAGPWMKVSQAIDYAIKLAPKHAFPVHDMILHPQFAAFVPVLVGNIVAEHGVAFKTIELNTAYEF
ncbi:MAG: MBL fold metallo-hydrolase [Candidatus Pacebacteria bacterium]|nr:MBL fold metallo-hydrolase [Candidatus Paceibacterota bacterium]